MNKEIVVMPIQVKSKPVLKYLCYWCYHWVYNRDKNKVCDICLKSKAIPRSVIVRNQKLINKGIFII